MDEGQTQISSGFAGDVALMTRRYLKFSFALLTMLLFLHGSAQAQKSAGPQGPEDGVIRRQSWLIPAQDAATLMWTNVFRPPGAGPFPLVVINHGSTQNEFQRAQMHMPEYAALTEWLVARGYAVAVPQRPGHGKTGGRYDEEQGSCDKADYRRAGLGTAGPIAAAIDHLIRQPFVQKTGVVVIGQSAGGWGALALASQHYAPLKSVIAFAPGRGGHVNGEANHNCAPERLIETARQFGERTRDVPSLWIYAENDSYFGPDLSRKVADAYRLAGGRAEYHLLPPVGSDGHDLVHAREAVPLWSPLLDKFLKPGNF
jgi:dienelactone hydrolase